jgi:CubicO group peptidase (beta-lactamase class C family)
MRSIVFALLVGVSTNVCLAQTASQDLGNYFSDLGNRGELNGNVLVAEKGKILYQGSFGHADFENGRLNSVDSEFNIASISKTFTAIAILQLKEKGRIALDDKFAKYFPDFPYPAITIRQLLSHSSGLSDTDLANIFTGFSAKHPGRVLTNNDLVALLHEAKIPLKLQPGEKWWYCNLGFQLLALLVEKVSGEAFSDYLAKHIFRPAKMDHTYLKTARINRADSPALSQNYDYPFTFSAQRVRFTAERSYYNDALFGHSNIVTTTADLLRYDTALYDGTLLSNDTLEEALTASKLKSGELNKVWLNLGGMGNALQGLGWFIFEDTSAGKIVWHTGGMPGCATIFLRNLTRRQTVVLLDNTNSEALYRKGLSAMNILNAKPILTFQKSLAKIYGRALAEKGADYAAVRLNELRADSVNYKLTENEMNNMAYEMLEHGFGVQALETFKINTFLYPESDNVYESYAEALAKLGKKAEALTMVRKSLQLNPANEDAKKLLETMDGVKPLEFAK